MSQHVDKVEVEVSGLGAEIQVQQFDLSVGVNDIPRLTLEILPVEAKKGQTEASAPSFSEITRLYHQLFAKSLDLQQKATVSIKISSKDKACGNQELNLKNWILTDVGLSSVTTYSAPSLVIILQHPIVNLTRTGAIYEVPQQDFYREYMVLKGTNMVNLMDDLFTNLAGTTFKFCPLPENESSNTAKAFRTNLANDLPGKYLKQESGGLFLGGQAGEAARLLKVSLASIMQPVKGSISTWYIIISRICPFCIMHVRPTYDQDQLSLEPLQPWYSSGAHKINEDLIESIDLIARDPDPICGTSFSRKNPGIVTESASTLAWHYSDMNGVKTPVCPYSFYIPSKAKPDSKKYGRIVELGSNVIISGMQQYAGAVSSSKSTATDLFPPTTRQKMEDAHAKAQFQAMYRKNCRASVTTTLMFKDSDGKMIYPGEIMTVSAEGKDLFSGYLSRMIVSGSTTNGCLAKYELNYARSAKEDRLLVDGNPKNECFSS